MLMYSVYQKVSIFCTENYDFIDRYALECDFTSSTATFIKAASDLIKSEYRPQRASGIFVHEDDHEKWGTYRLELNP